MGKVIFGLGAIATGVWLIVMYLSREEMVPHLPATGDEISLPPLAWLVIGIIMVLVGIIQLLPHKNE